MKFKGTIVITDPCYLDSGLGENLWSESNYGEDLSVYGCSQWLCESTIYGDWSCFTYKGTRQEALIHMIDWDKIYSKFFIEYNNETSEKNRKKLAEQHAQIKKEFVEKYTLGKFCADAGMVCVVYLDEILKVNPNFKEWAEKHPWCATIIEDFDGLVTYEVDDSDEAHIVGTGNIEFYTSQSGL